MSGETTSGVIAVSVPVRICDNGGWTDTWFGGPGRVLNLAVAPGVRVAIRDTAGPDPVWVHVTGTDDRYALVPGSPRVARHPLVEAAIDAAPPPPGVPVEIEVCSAVPAGCGAGTSAAVAVALLAGLRTLRAEPWTPREIAYTAHRLETEGLGLESGIQDQLAAAFGGINDIEIDAYPEASVQPLPPWEELSARLTLVFLGRAHDSSSVHEAVIERVAQQGPHAFDRLRDAAVAARDAVDGHDLAGFGDAMIRNTAGQRALHPDLVGADAGRVIDHVARLGAIGWKVNGAGGDGGSLTLLSPTVEAKHALERAITDLDPRYEVFPVEISALGVEVEDTR